MSGSGPDASLENRKTDSASGVSRRQFLVTAGAACISGWMSNGLLLNGSGPDNRLRVIAYNVYGFSGWPKDRTLAQRASEKRQIARRVALELALYEPDLVTFSESPGPSLTQEVAEQMDMYQVRFPSGGSWPGTLLSRFPISEHENVPVKGGKRPSGLFTRHWGRAAVRMPGDHNLIVHSAHLHPSDQETRIREITAMLEAMEPALTGEQSVLLMGDLNHTPSTREYRMWKEAGWVDTFSAVGKGQGKTIKADRPGRRIDYVLAAGPIADAIISSKPLFRGAFRTNPDDPASFALSDHLPQMAEFAIGK